MLIDSGIPGSSCFSPEPKLGLPTPFLIFLCLHISTVQNTYFKMASNEVLIVPVMSFFFCTWVSVYCCVANKPTTYWFEIAVTYFSQFCGLNWVWSLQGRLSRTSAALVLPSACAPSPLPPACLLPQSPNIVIGLQLRMVAGFQRAKSRCHQVSSGLSRIWYNVTLFGQSESQSCPDSRQGETDSTSWQVEHRSSEGGKELLADRNS